MQLGDIVKVKSVQNLKGILVGFDQACGWWKIFLENGKIVIWPPSQIEVINVP